MSSEIPGAQLAEFYTQVRVRLCATMSGLTAEELATPVPGCPGWTVKDTFGHVVGNPQDGLAGRIQGIPDEEFTSGQVARFADVSVADMIASWESTEPQMAPVITAIGRNIAPIVIDAHIHEQDILNALGRNEARDVPGLRWFVEETRSDWPMDIPADDFEVIRARLGRRSLAQVSAWPWQGDFDPSFFIFGPRDDDLVE